MSEYVQDTPLGYDGYERMGFVQRFGWKITPSWGRDGWDLGSWPLVSVMFREKDGQYQVRYDVEGDVKISSFATEEERNKYVDGLAFFGEPWVEGMETVDDMPDYMRGPFTWERLGRDGVQKGEQE
jgi:hypothetical protein